MEIRCKALVWRGKDDEVTGFLTANTQDGTQIIATMSSLDLNSAKWEEIVITIPGSDRDPVKSLFEVFGTKQ